MKIFDIFKKHDEEHINFSERSTYSRGSKIAYKFKFSQTSSLLSVLAVALVGGALVINAQRFNATPERSQAAFASPSPSPSPSATPTSLPKRK